ADEETEPMRFSSVGYRHAGKLPHDVPRVNPPTLSPEAESRGLWACARQRVTPLTFASKNTRMAITARRLRRAAGSGRIPTRRRSAPLFPLRASAHAAVQHRRRRAPPSGEPNLP